MLNHASKPGDEVLVAVEYAQGDHRDRQTLRLALEPSIVSQGGRWYPGVVVQESPKLPDWIVIPEEAGLEADAAFHAEIIVYAINEGEETSGETAFFADFPDLAPLHLRWNVENS